MIARRLRPVKQGYLTPRPRSQPIGGCVRGEESAASATRNSASFDRLQAANGSTCSAGFDLAIFLISGVAEG